MSIKGYWGSNGSYKSASAVQYDIIPELLKGRVVVTNIRGCTLEKCIAQYPDIPDSADVIHINTEEAGAYQKMRTWFRWAPHGALIVIDEIQLFHLKSWRERDLEKFILRVKDSDTSPERLATEEEAESLEQPWGFLEAFTKHRHFNWDIVFTTPHIKYLRDDIRQTTEACYRQANGALLGFKGRFKRSMHDADDNKPPKDALTQTLSINKKTFLCYDSTKTGKVQDTRAGTNILKSPRLLMALALSIGSLTYALSSSGLDYITKGPEHLRDKEALSASTEAVSNDALVVSEEVISSDITSYSNINDPDIHSKQSDNDNDQLINVDVFSEYDATISYFEGFSSGKVVYFLIEFDKWKESGQSFSISSGELIKIGYRFKWLTECAVMLYFGKESRLITCYRPTSAKSEIDVQSSDFNPVNNISAPTERP